MGAVSGFDQRSVDHTAGWADTAAYAHLQLRRHPRRPLRILLSVGYFTVIALVALVVVNALNHSTSGGALGSRLASAPARTQAHVRGLALSQIPRLDRRFPATATRRVPARHPRSPARAQAKSVAVPAPAPPQPTVATHPQASAPSGGTSVTQAVSAPSVAHGVAGGGQNAGAHSGIASGGG